MLTDIAIRCAARSIIRSISRGVIIICAPSGSSRVLMSSSPPSESRLVGKRRGVDDRRHSYRNNGRRQTLRLSPFCVSHSRAGNYSGVRHLNRAAKPDRRLAARASTVITTDGLIDLTAPAMISPVSTPFFQERRESCWRRGGGFRAPWNRKLLSYVTRRKNQFEHFGPKAPGVMSLFPSPATSTVPSVGSSSRRASATASSLPSQSCDDFVTEAPRRCNICPPAYQ